MILWDEIPCHVALKVQLVHTDYDLQIERWYKLTRNKNPMAATLSLTNSRRQDSRDVTYRE
jgi:hypothetical protein